MVGETGDPSYLERTHHLLINGHHGSRVVELSTIIRRGEKRDEPPLCEKLEPVFDHLPSSSALRLVALGYLYGWVLAHLMPPANQIQIMLLRKPRDDVRAERKPRASVVLPPTRDVLVGIAPEDVREHAYPIFNVIQSMHYHRHV